MYTLKEKEEMKKFEKLIGYEFNNLEYLLRAMTHSSFANEKSHKKISSNERYEFLGDSILSIIVSEHIFANYVYLPEGELTRIRAASVCEPSLAKCARSIEIGKYIFLGKGERSTGGNDRDSILSDCFEALIAAIYLDSNLINTKEWTLLQLEDTIKKAVDGLILRDYKTLLQEYYQKISRKTVKYITIGEKGPDHNKVFFVNAFHNNVKIGEGSGKTKKEAEQKAAQKALEKLKLSDKKV